MTKVSVIVTTYNKERELSLVLEAYRHQTYQDFEIVVADDGSGPETVKVIENARRTLNVPIKHSWQEDDGFRAARSRNLAILKCSGEIIAMTDGDCLPLPDYVASIATNFEKQSYRAGERYLLSEEEAAAISLEAIVNGGAEYLKSQVPERELKRVGKIAKKNRWYRLFRLKERPKVMTCNFVAWRADIDRINGFDERYVGWGHEDTDLGRRFRKIGVRSKEKLSPGKMIHLWHKTESSFAGRVRDCPNAEYFERGFYLAKCRQGLQKRSFQDFSIKLTGEFTELAKNAFSTDLTSAAELEILWGTTNKDQFESQAEIFIYVVRSQEISKKAIDKAHIVLALEDQKHALQKYTRQKYTGKQIHCLTNQLNSEAGLEECKQQILAIL